VELV
jgi:hypothetical protein